jgi:outer membrane lipoprotein-sorting protein
MRTLSFILLGGVGALYFAQSGSGTLQAHVKTLQDAPSLTATLTAQPIGGAPEIYKITYSKPNFLKIETPTGWTLDDGKTIYAYDKKENTWTESPATDDSLKQTAGLNQTWAWRAFFDKDAFKALTGAKAGASRVIKGTPTTELVVTLENASATLFIDPKLGMARGFTYKSSEADLLVTSTDIAIGKEALSPDAFAFHAPADAKKVEAPKPDDATFANVRALLGHNCMPCHGPAQRSGGYDLTTYDGVLQGVTPGNPPESRILQVVSPPNPSMPKMRPPLKQSEVDMVSKWIENGAKKN